MEHEQMTGDVEEEHRLQVSPEELKVIRETLLDRSLTMAQRYRSVFTLRNIGGDEAISILAESFNDPSALLKHEVAYCLGQMQNVTALPHLERLLRNAEENSMVRHEAGEALGAIGLEESLPLLEQYSRDSVPEVAETCSLAIDTIKYKLKHKGSKAPFESAHMSIDPAPPSAKRSVEDLKQRLMNTSFSMFKRYRAMFALRELGTAEAAMALADAFVDSSALLRHEIGYVLGQMAHEAAAPALTKVLQNLDEHPMVRHEAAEALGAIATPEAMDLLGQFLTDKEPAVKESCVVALDMSEYVNSDSFEYADTLQLAKAQLAAAQ
jgi:deoxyhypusine monooxygenase